MILQYFCSVHNFIFEKVYLSMFSPKSFVLDFMANICYDYRRDVAARSLLPIQKRRKKLQIHEQD